MDSKKTDYKNAFLLLSGGMDSAACLDLLLESSYNITCLFVNYGQLAYKKERQSAKKITKFYRVNLIDINVVNAKLKETGYIQGRNLFLFSIALAEMPFERGIISSGIHNGTDYNDCTLHFQEKVQEIFNIYSNGRIRIFSPFAEWNKKNIWDYCQQKKVPLNLTYSCERGGKIPCGECLTCSDLNKLHACQND